MRRRSILSAASVLVALCVAVVLALCLAPVGVSAETKPTPFTAPAAGAAPPSAFAPPAAAPLQATGPIGAIFSWVVDTQQTMQRELANGVKRLKTENAFAAAVGLAALSFLYGVVHAVGPGHGKTIISSYVVANEQTVRRGVIISFIAAALQAMTAVALVGVLAIVMNASGMAEIVDAPTRKRQLCPDRDCRSVVVDDPASPYLARVAENGDRSGRRSTCCRAR